ncbi:hypothetical protein ACH5RR_018055 [Cinchona calisaya]|uniref:LOB domain-containing protein n=1 Tax=Cinchona calisaya TaxID=153742 RepID=A0ABD2ZKC1_9GENT
MTDDNYNNNNIPSNEEDSNHHLHNHNNNNNNNNNTEVGNHPACAACKHQRKKCRKDCILSKHFPAEKTAIFKTVHKVFGTSHLTKTIKGLQLHEQEEAVKSFEWEASQWEKDPVHGPLGQYKILERNYQQSVIQQCDELLNENNFLKEKLKTIQPGVENMQNYCNSSGNLSLLPARNNSNYNGVFFREDIGQGSSNNGAQGSVDGNFAHDQQGGEVVPAGCYSVNHVGMGNQHVGQSSRTSYNSFVHGMMHNPYSTTHPTNIDIRNGDRGLGIPIRAYPNTPDQHRQFTNASQRNTPGKS